MEQTKFYKYAAIALLILNVTMVGFFITRRPPHHHHVGNSRNAPEILNLDGAQRETFLNLVDEHRNAMEPINNNQAELLKPYFSGLYKDNGTIDQDSSLQYFQTLERDKIQLTYDHLLAIKSILKPEQLSNWEEFLDHALERILMKSKNGPRPRK